MIELNEIQKKIIEQPIENRIIVHGGPGVGKTETMIQRIIFLLNNNNIDFIIVLSFTNAAIYEIQKRIKDIQRIGAKNIFITTIDKYAFRMIKNNENYGERYEIDLNNFESTIKDATELIKNEKLIKNNTIICELDTSYLSSINHIFLDEFQDLYGARAEFVLELFTKISKENEKFGFTIFYDTCQEIYSYDTSESDFISNSTFASSLFKGIFEAKKYSLDESFKDSVPYRFSSNKKLYFELKKVRDWIENKQNINSDSINLESIKKIQINNIEQLLEYLNDEKKLKNDVIILFRKNLDALIFSAWLFSKNINHLFNIGEHFRIIPWWVCEIINNLSKPYNESTDPNKYIIKKEDFKKYFEENKKDKEKPIFKELIGIKDEEFIWSLLSYIILGDSSPREKIIYSNLNSIEKRYMLPNSTFNIFLPHRITLSSIHKSKGRQYPIVYLWDYQFNTLEELKIFYVAMSRASMMFYQIISKSRIQDIIRNDRNFRSVDFSHQYMISDPDLLDPVSFVDKTIELSLKKQKLIESLQIGNKLLIKLWNEERKINAEIYIYPYHYEKSICIAKFNEKGNNKMIDIFFSILKKYQLNYDLINNKYEFWFKGLYVVCKTSEFLLDSYDIELISIIHLQKKIWFGFIAMGILEISRLKKNEKVIFR